MDLNMIQTFITSVGFPIAACAVLGIFFYKFVDRVMTQNKEREDKLYEIMNKNADQMNNFQESFKDTVVVLGKLRDDVDGIKDILNIMAKEVDDGR